MHDFVSWENFLEILTKPDNIPIAAMIPIVLFYTWWAMSEARKNDKLIDEGREDEVIHRMRE
jgi:hypothetical protein